MTSNANGRAGVVLGAMLGLSLAGAAQAQTIPSALDPGWRFSLTPYLWLPSISGELRYSPRNDVSANVKVDAQNVVDALNFGLTFGAEARRGRFSLATDLLYLDLGSQSSQVRHVDFGASGRVQSSTNLGTQTQFTSTLWTLAPGYTVLEGAWGNLDLQAGFRVLSLRSRTDVQLVTDITGPRQGETFSRTGRLSANEQIWDGIVGVRGRIELGSGFYLPYAADVGGGGSNLTWQVQGGLGYSTGWAGVVAGYRYLSYSQGSNSLVQELNMGGAFIALNMKF